MHLIIVETLSKQKVMSSPAELVEQIARTDGLALVRFAYQLTHDHHLAEDVVQTALIRVLTYTRTHSTIELHNPRAYLRTCIVREYLGFRRRLPNTEQPVDVAVLAPSLAVVDNFDIDVVNQDEVWRALDDLPPRQRVVLVMRYYSDLSDSEIAEALNCKRSTVRSLANRAIHSLRPKFEPQTV
jgi:RNA polymerase sigma factor (sigma-70 family)